MELFNSQSELQDYANSKSTYISVYIKPTDYVHDSGYRCFEVGYCIVENYKVIAKYMIGTTSDHIAYNYFNNHELGLFGFDINLDLTLDGYIRIFSTTHYLV